MDPMDKARLMAVEVLLAEPGKLGDDVLEACLYVQRDKLWNDLVQGTAGA